MRSVKPLLVAGVAAFLSTAAHSADLPIMPPPYMPPPVHDFGGWYLRGDIGISNQQVKRLDNALDSTLFTQDQRLNFDSAGIFGLGVGYKFNNWFRMDATGEYRSSATFHGLDLNTFSTGAVGTGTGFGVDNYHASKSEWLVLANAYVDLGTWWCITPFIGAGVGAARVTIANFTDQGLTNDGVNPLAPSSAYADTASKWNFAWAAHAGLAYQVTPNVTMELAYRYVDLGSGITGDIRPFDGPGSVVNPMTFSHITSHDVKLGLRWACCDVPPPPPPPPLIRKG